MSLVTLRSVTAVALLAIACASEAANYVESGDAGDLPGTAQTTVGSGPLTSIQGTLVSDLDRDMYCIRVLDPPNFSASISCTVIAEDDLWLFRQNGTGVAGNDGCSGGVVVVGTPLVTLAGLYLLAISPSADEPRSGALTIWNPPSAAGQRPPDGPGAVGAIDNWSGTGVLASSGVNYTINITGAAFCDTPVPVAPGTWGRVKSLYR
jgi:hypothetical protein